MPYSGNVNKKYSNIKIGVYRFYVAERDCRFPAAGDEADCCSAAIPSADTFHRSLPASFEAYCWRGRDA